MNYINPYSLERTIASYQGSSLFSLRREEEDEKQDDNEGDSDAASFYEEEQEQDQEWGQLSEYEQLRQSNILRNDRVLKQLGFKTNLPASGTAWRQTRNEKCLLRALATILC